MLDPSFATDSDNISDIGNTHLYTGREQDPETGLQLNRHRFYAPHLARWLTRDPTGYVDEFNLYNYLRNTPLGFVDPTGLQTRAITRKRPIEVWATPIPVPDAQGNLDASESQTCEWLTKDCPGDKTIFFESAEFFFNNFNYDDSVTCVSKLTIVAHGRAGQVSLTSTFSTKECKRRNVLNRFNVRMLDGSRFCPNCEIFVAACGSESGGQITESSCEKLTHFLQALANQTGCTVKQCSGITNPPPFFFCDGEIISVEPSR